MEEDTRWEQRFSNYKKAFHKLKDAIGFVTDHSKAEELQKGSVLDEIVKEGIIQRFEYTHELAWNVMKDYALWQGNTSVGGSRDATREALQLQIIADGQTWMDMIGSRNQTSHTYNETTADEIFGKIIQEYYPAFEAFQQIMEEKRKEQE
ncbi:MAG: nucleotidyltransferase substrate binding protein [Bacteroidales bacterium]